MDRRKIRENSTTQRLIKTIGLEEVEKTWQRLGMYKGSEELSKRSDILVSPFVLRYMSYKYNWKRNVNKLSPIYKGVKAGKVPAAYYKHLIFPMEENENGTNQSGGFYVEDNSNTTAQVFDGTLNFCDITSFTEPNTVYGSVRLTASGYPTAKTSAQLKDINTFTGWDFTNTWAIDSTKNNGYPFIK